MRVDDAPNDGDDESTAIGLPLDDRVEQGEESNSRLAVFGQDASTVSTALIDIANTVKRAGHEVAEEGLTLTRTTGLVASSLGVWGLQSLGPLVSFHSPMTKVSKFAMKVAAYAIPGSDVVPYMLYTRPEFINTIRTMETDLLAEASTNNLLNDMRDSPMFRAIESEKGIQNAVLWSVVYFEIVRMLYLWSFAMAVKNKRLGKDLNEIAAWATKIFRVALCMPRTPRYTARYSCFYRTRDLIRWHWAFSSITKK